MKFTLPNGVTIETGSAEEVAQMLGAMGLAPAASKPDELAKPAKASLTDQSSARWTLETAALLLEKMNPSGRALVEKLVVAGSMTTEALRLTFGYNDKRGIGGMLGPAKRTAKELLLPSPITSHHDDDGEKVLTIDPELQIAIRKIKQSASKGTDV